MANTHIRSTVYCDNNNMTSCNMGRSDQIHNAYIMVSSLKVSIANYKFVVTINHLLRDKSLSKSRYVCTYIQYL